MKKRVNNNKEVFMDILINIRYMHSMNKFEEFYGDSVNYSDLEQESYIDLKNVTTSFLKRKIKFRKYQREGMVLTVKAEMTDTEYKKMLDLFHKKPIELSSEFVVSEIKILIDTQ